MGKIREDLFDVDDDKSILVGQKIYRGLVIDKINGKDVTLKSDINNQPTLMWGKNNVLKIFSKIFFDFELWINGFFKGPNRVSVLDFKGLSLISTVKNKEKNGESGSVVIDTSLPIKNLNIDCDKLYINNSNNTLTNCNIIANKIYSSNIPKFVNCNINTHQFNSNWVYQADLFVDLLNRYSEVTNIDIPREIGIGKGFTCYFIRLQDNNELYIFYKDVKDLNNVYGSPKSKQNYQDVQIGKSPWRVYWCKNKRTII